MITSGILSGIRRGTLFPFAAALGILTIATVPAQDTVFLKNGRRAECEVRDFTSDALKITWRPSPGAAPVDRLVPMAEVDYLELAPLPGESDAMAAAVRDGRPDPLIQYWVKRIPWLGRPRTNAGEIGLVYAELLTRIPTPDRMERALTIYRQIESADWSEERRGRAQAGRLRVMLRQGRVAEVRPQAEALVRESGDPRVLIELRHVMAEASAASLTQLETDHPRWSEEDDIVPEHARLLNEAYDGYLYPHLFHGAEEDLAARGLWAASQLSAAQQDLPQAGDWVTDLTELYPETPQAGAARAWLEKHPGARVPPAGAGSPSGAGDDAGESDEPPAPPKKSGKKPRSSKTREEKDG